MDKTRYKNIDAYIKAYPKDIATRLQAIRMAVRKIAPQAEEVISYNMPAFKLNGILLYFAAHAKHIGMYPFSSTIKDLGKDLAKYQTSKGTIQFQHDKPLPLPLVRKIVKYRVVEKLRRR